MALNKFRIIIIIMLIERCTASIKESKDQHQNKSSKNVSRLWSAQHIGPDEIFLFKSWDKFCPQSVVSRLI